MRIVFDLDGTLANDNHRNHLAKAGRWDEYFDACDEDLPIPHAIEVLQSLASQGETSNRDMELGAAMGQPATFIKRPSSGSKKKRSGMHSPCCGMRP